MANSIEGGAVNLHESLELEPLPLPLPTGEWGVTVEGENVEYAAKFLYLSDDKRVAVGIERLGPSKLTGTHVGESLYYLAGRVTCLPVGGLYELKAGLCHFPAGVGDVWEIEGDVREALRDPLGGVPTVLSCEDTR